MDVSGNLVTSQNPIHQGQIIVLWATGLGDLIQQGDLLQQKNPAPITFGASQPKDGGGFNVLNSAWKTVTPIWAGESPQYPGLDQLNVIFPSCTGTPATSEQRYDIMLSFQAPSADSNLGIGFATLYMPFIISPGDPTCQFGAPITLSSSQNPSISDQPVSFTAILPSTLPGTVTFLDGSAALGIQALIPCTSIQRYCTGPSGTGSIASITVPNLTSGTHSIIASYQGTASPYDASTSPVLAQSVLHSASASVSSNQNPSIAGQTVTFTATVTPSMCTGTIIFFDGDSPNKTTLGTATLSGGTARLVTANLNVGSNPIRISYGGDASCSTAVSAYDNTQATLIQTVTQNKVTITLTSTPNPSASGQMVTFTACGLPVPTTGTVAFYDGATLLATNNNVYAACSSYGTNVLSVGTHYITAHYSGDSTYNASVSQVQIQTVQGTTTMSLTSSVNPAVVGQAVVFTATISPSTATGTVTFNIANKALVDVTVVGGKAVCDSSCLGSGASSLLYGIVGTAQIIATYHGDSLYTGSSGTLVQVINSTGSADITPPTVRALAFTPTTINTANGAATVTVNFTVTDDLSGIASISIGFMSPSGQQQVFATPDSSTWAKGSLSVVTSAVATFPKNCEAGTWTVWHVALYDVVGNSAFILPSQLSALGLPTQITVAGGGDTAPPNLRSLSFSPTTINTASSSAAVTVGFTVTDDISGVSSISIGFMSPSGQQQVFATPDSTTWAKGALNVVTSAVATFPKNCETGTWTVWHVALYDVVGNSVYIQPSQLSAMGFPTQITVVGAGDVTPPSLRALSFSPTTISTASGSATVTVGFTITDDISGVSSISIGFMSPSGQQLVFATPDSTTWAKGALNVTTSGVATFPKNSETGTWTVWHVALYDVVGNSAFILPSQLSTMGFPTQITVH